MRYCSKCAIFSQDYVKTCGKEDCQLKEVDLKKALELTRLQAFKSLIGKESEISDGYAQYHIRGYLGNRSLFLDFDLHKYRLKHGPRLKRFLITPVSFFSLFNLPWLVYNLIATNLFHMDHTQYCSRCGCKVKPPHTQIDCDYNIEYFSILDDIISGRIIERKNFYQTLTDEKEKKGQPSAFNDLFKRPVKLEIFLDIVSITFSLFLWLYLSVLVCLPLIKSLIQQWQIIEASKFHLELR